MEIGLIGFDVKCRAAEVALSLIDMHGWMPNHNYVVKVDNCAYQISKSAESIHQIYSEYNLSLIPVGVIDSLPTGTFVRAQSINRSIRLYLDEVVDLSLASSAIIQTSFNKLTNMYHNLLEQQRPMLPFTYFALPKFPKRIFGCLKYKMYGGSDEKRTAYNCHHQQLFVLCDPITQNNYQFSSNCGPIIYELNHSSTQQVGDCLISYRIVHLLPSTLVPKTSTGKLLNGIFYGAPVVFPSTSSPQSFKWCADIGRNASSAAVHQQHRGAIY